MIDQFISFVFLMIGAVYHWGIKGDFDSAVIFILIALVFGVWSGRNELFVRNRNAEKFFSNIQNDQNQQGGDQNADQR